MEGVPFGESLKMIATLGLPTVLVCWFVYWSKTREDVMMSRVAELEKFIRDTLIRMVEDTTSTHRSVEAQVSMMCKALDKQCSMLADLKSRMDMNPCLLHSDARDKILKAVSGKLDEESS